MSPGCTGNTEWYETDDSVAHRAWIVVLVWKNIIILLLLFPSAGSVMWGWHSQSLFLTPLPTFSKQPIVPNAVDQVPVDELRDTHVHMKNHHQGMFLATSYLLRKWRDRRGCNFDKVRDRPGMRGRPSQPSEGTQRVWMSSQMLYGGRHCGVQQVIPIESFGTLTVLHLPNKNYRRVGRYHNRTFSDGTETFDHGISAGLLTAMTLHIELKRLVPPKARIPYDGVRMVDEVEPEGRMPLLERRMAEYQAYVERGGVLSEDDMKKTALVEER
jgi:hypothetical protein